MAKTYILIESSGMATMIPERDIERVAAERMVSGQAFQIYRAEPMKLQVSLTPATGAAPFAIPAAKAPADGRRKAGAKKGRRKKAAGKKKAAKKTTRKTSAAGRVGRPPVNVGPCTVAGCGRPSKTRGLCSAHYQQHRRLMREGKQGLMSGAAAAPAAKKKAAKKTAGRRGPGRPRKTAKAAPKTVAPQTPPPSKES